MNNYKLQKAVAIVEQVRHTAGIITTTLKDMPRTGKKRRNIFIKSYNRRPDNKRKRAMIMAKAAIDIYIGAASLYIIQSQPIPKYPEGKTF